MPTTVATCERSFSEFRVLKNYQDLSQERLSNLAILFVENKNAGAIDFGIVIDEFATIKRRKVLL